MKGKTSIFIVLVVLFCTALIVSNIIAGKLWQLPLGIVLTAGVTLFPMVYIIGDVVPEVYGFQTARRVIWLGFAANAVAVVFFYVCLMLTPPIFWTGQDAFQVVLGFTPRLLAASFCGYLIGTHANAWTLVFIKRLTNARFLWMRTIGSTIVGESLDSVTFMSLAFLGVVPLEALPMMILAQAAFKTTYEIVATPLTYVVVGWVKQREGQVAPVTT